MVNLRGLPAHDGPRRPGRAGEVDRGPKVSPRPPRRDARLRRIAGGASLYDCLPHARDLAPAGVQWIADKPMNLWRYPEEWRRPSRIPGGRVGTRRPRGRSQPVPGADNPVAVRGGTRSRRTSPQGQGLGVSPRVRLGLAPPIEPECPPPCNVVARTRRRYAREFGAEAMLARESSSGFMSGIQPGPGHRAERRLLAGPASMPRRRISFRQGADGGRGGGRGRACPKQALATAPG